MALKWGIASAGKISWDFTNALSTLPAADHQVVAVAARDLTRAQEFARKFDIPNAYGTYLELAKDPSVEIVYIGMLNPQHYEVALLMLEHGKHILVEKPFCMNEKQARAVIESAKSRKLFVMEALWSRFFPTYQYLRQQIENGALGEVQSVHAEFGFPTELQSQGHKDRIGIKALGGGSIIDMGVYTIQMCQFVFKEAPKSFKASGTLNSDGVDADMKAELTYADGKVAHIESSVVKTLKNTATVRGTKGEITLIDFWAPTTLRDVDGTEKTFPVPKGRHEFNYPNSAGLRYEAEEVRKCIRANKLENETAKHNDTLIIAQIEDELRKQIGVVYDADLD